MKAIIGKNSRLVGLLDLDCTIQLFSHDQINDIQFHLYSQVIVFSWINDVVAMEELIKEIPAEKLIFVSTLAVYSELVRAQWNAYPRCKLVVERRVLDLGGRVVRLGFTELNSDIRHFGCLPFTSLRMIEDFCHASSYPDESVIDLYDLQEGSATTSIIDRICYSMSRFFSNKYARIFFEGVSKVLFRGAPYGYSGDLLWLFRGKILVGDGVLGHSVVKNNSGYLILTSPNPDTFLTSNGFIDTRIGYDGTGLRKYWHGVRIHKSGAIHVKRVPAALNRSPTRHALKLHVEALRLCGNQLALVVETQSVPSARLPVSKLILAAGPVSNCLILRDFWGSEVSFSDHEICVLGTVSMQDQFVRDQLHIWGPFIAARSVSVNSDHLAEVRPSAGLGKFRPNHNMYNNSVTAIIKELFQSYSIKRLNQAFFNRFGFGFRTTLFDLCIQATAQDCINLRADGFMSRTRLGRDFWTGLKEKYADVAPSFVPVEDVQTNDAQHIVGGREVLENKTLIDLIKQGKVVILGSPTYYMLKASHHTVDLIHLGEQHAK